MADRLVTVADGFYNIRGSFRIAGLIDIGTQCSLARLGGGGFVLLDSYPLTGEVGAQVRAMTDDGRAIRAVLNLHPFHTIHVRTTHQAFPDAKLYGTARHVEQAPDLPWQPERCEDPALHALFADDFRFTVPRGVDFVSPDPRLHFASVLALHRATGTLHVDDTLTYTSLPLIGGLAMHPTLGSVLQKRAGAVADFRAWTDELLALCAEAKHLCTAHMRTLPPSTRPVLEQVRDAVAAVDKTLTRHAARWG